MEAHLEVLIRMAVTKGLILLQTRQGGLNLTVEKLIRHRYCFLPLYLALL
jgi:hypothetical protein